MRRFTLILLFFISKEVSAMGFLEGLKACTFSSMSGHIYYEGKPLSNVKITRKAKYQKEASEESTTDENGYFEFDAMYEKSILKVFPQQYVSSQYVFVTFNGKEHKIWTGVKFSPDENTESDGDKIVVSCDLKDEVQPVHYNGQTFITSCQWNVTPTKYDAGFEK